MLIDKIKKIIEETDKKTEKCISTNHAHQKLTKHLYCVKCLEIVNDGYYKIKELLK